MSVKYFWDEDPPMFPFRVVLISTPDNEYAAANMTIGKQYTAFELNGSCYVVSDDRPGDRTLVWRGRFETVKP